MPPTDPASRRIRVLCVDDHRIVRDGLALMIGREADMEVAGFAAGGEEAVGVYDRIRPDVTLMDLHLTGMSGVETIKAIRRMDPNARIVVLTMSQAEEDIHRALDAGAAAYLVKDTAFDDLIRIIRRTRSGQPVAMSADVRARLAARASRPTLTARELEVLELVRRGLRNREIGSTLRITEETVQTHIKNILGKLEVQDRTAAIDVALRRGLIHLP